jgi:hypothetical protein
MKTTYSPRAQPLNTSALILGVGFLAYVKGKATELHNRAINDLYDKRVNFNDCDSKDFFFLDL